MKALSLSLLGIGLAACSLTSPSSVVRNVEVYSLYEPSLVRWAGAGRDLPLVVIQNENPGQSEPWEESIGAILSSNAWLQADRVTARPDGSERGNFDITVVVNAPITLGAKDACAGEIDPLSLLPIAGESHVLVTFCNEDRPVSTARAVVANITGSGAPQLSLALNAAVQRAFPRFDPNRPGITQFLLSI